MSKETDEEPCPFPFLHRVSPYQVAFALKALIGCNPTTAFLVNIRVTQLVCPASKRVGSKLNPGIRLSSFLEPIERLQGVHVILIIRSF